MCSQKITDVKSSLRKKKDKDLKFGYMYLREREMWTQRKVGLYTQCTRAHRHTFTHTHSTRTHGHTCTVHRAHTDTRAHTQTCAQHTHTQTHTRIHVHSAQSTQTRAHRHSIC